MTCVPAAIPQLTQLIMRVRAEQTNQWAGTLVTAQITCPGLLTDISRKILNAHNTVFFNFAANAAGNFKGTAGFSWPNGERLVVNFFYEVTP